MGQAPFIHPGLAAAALAAGLIPVLIHFLNRRRHVRVPWAAMSFLLAANRKSKRRVRFEQWLLMAARIAVIVLLGAAVARPYIPRSSLLPVAAARSHHVLVIDNSLSTCAHEGGQPARFEIGRQWIDRLLLALPASDAVSVVALAAPASPLIAEGSFDRRFVRESVGALACTERAGDIIGGLERAREIVENSDSAPANRFVYLVSDLPRRDWTSRSGGEPAPAAAAMAKLVDALDDPGQLVIVRTAKDDGETVGISSLTVDSSLMGVGVPVSIAAVVTNYGPTVLRGRTLEIRQGQQVIRRETIGTLEPQATKVVAMSTQFSAPGSHLIEAQLNSAAGDALQQDDRRFLAVDVPDTVRVLLIDGEPGATPLSGQAGFLAAALSPSSILGPDEGQSGGVDGRGATPVTVRITSDAELVGEALPEYAVVVLCNVQRLSEEQWRLLEKFVSRGGGLAIFGGGLVSIENYNRYAGRSDGLIPGRFERGGADAGESTRSAGSEPLGFKVGEVPHPIVSEFAALPLSGLFVARVTQYLPFEPDASRAEIVLHYTNGQPAVVASRFGGGRVVVCTTTANMDWTNLPAKGDYVSLVASVVSYLAPRTDKARNVLVGQTVREPVTAAQASLPMQVVSPDGLSAAPVVEPSGEGLLLRFGPVEPSGVARLTLGSEVREYAVNVDPAESHLAPMEWPAFVSAVGRPVRAVVPEDATAAGSSPSQVAELATAGFVAVLVLLLIETLLAARFGRQRV